MTIESPAWRTAALSKVEIVTAEQARSMAGASGYEPFCPGSFTEAVWLEWMDSTRPRRALVGASDPRALSRAVEEARVGRVRVDASAVTTAGGSGDPEAETEMDAAAEASAGSAKRGA